MSGIGLTDTDAYSAAQIMLNQNHPISVYAVNTNRKPLTTPDTNQAIRYTGDNLTAGAHMVISLAEAFRPGELVSVTFMVRCLSGVSIVSVQGERVTLATADRERFGPPVDASRFNRFPLGDRCRQAFDTGRRFATIGTES